MDQSLDAEWQDLVARLEATPSLPDDNGFAHWGVASGLMGLVPLVTPETLPISIPFATAALVLGMLGMHAAVGLGRGHRRALAAALLGLVPLVTASLLLALSA